MDRRSTDRALEMPVNRGSQGIVFDRYLTGITGHCDVAGNKKAAQAAFLLARTKFI